jgi:hypothetical protein
MVAIAQAEVAATSHGSVAFVDAPTALAGFQLVLRLPRSRSQSKRGGPGRWVVHVPVTGPDAVRRLLDDVQLWLHGEQIAETRVRVGGDVYRVSREHAVTYPTTGRNR